MVHRFLARRAAAASALAGVVLTCSSAWAFCRTTTCSPNNRPAYCVKDPATGCWVIGAPLFWEQGCVSFSSEWNGSPKLGLSYVEADGLVTQAFARWLSVSCPSPSFDLSGAPSIAVMSAGPTWCERKEFNPEGPNSNAVLFVDEGWVASPSALAITTVSFNAKTGRIYGADLEVNTEMNDFTPKQLGYVLTHEAGHYLGLDHSVDPLALMNAFYSLADTDVLISADDVAAICTAYQPLRTTPACNPEPDNGYSSECGGNVEAGCALTLAPKTSVFAGGALALLALGFVRRRARITRSRAARAHG